MPPESTISTVHSYIDRHQKGAVGMSTVYLYSVSIIGQLSNVENKA